MANLSIRDLEEQVLSRLKRAALLFAETANVVCKKIRRAELSSGQGQRFAPTANHAHDPNGGQAWSGGKP